MQKFLFFFLFPVLLSAQPAQDLYLSFPATSPLLGTDSIKMWAHIPANYPLSGGGLMIGLHGLGDPNSSPDIRTYLTATSDNYGLLLVCAEPYLGQENATLIAKSKLVINETMDSVHAWYQTDLNQTYLCGYSAGSDVAAHYTLENPQYPVKGLIWFAPGFYGSLLYPSIDTSFAAPIPPICMCHGTADFVSQTSASRIETIFSASSVPFLSVSPAGIAHTMNYPALTADIATCMDFIIANSNTGISPYSSLQIKVFPNPAMDKLLIETNTRGLLKVEVSDVSGSVLSSDFFLNDDLRVINVNHLSSGIYFLKVTDEAKNSGVMKLIKR